MCDYCGCRSRPPVAQLARDHERIGDLVASVRSSLEDDDRPGVRAALVELAGVLRAHDALEEGGVYPELIAEGIATDALHADHAAVDATIRDVLAGSPRAWADLPSALDRLAAHIATEEYDLFPAAHQLLSDPAWDRIDEHHRSDQGHRHGQGHRHDHGAG